MCIHVFAWVLYVCLFESQKSRSRIWDKHSFECEFLSGTRETAEELSRNFWEGEHHHHQFQAFQALLNTCFVIARNWCLVKDSAGVTLSRFSGDVWMRVNA
ncbi:hypothetical protein Tcan_08029 [Toxocara canis]|uniref:Uncharacterized protein n=1 Tax=Toxocara canis TaxID=6265 RepID=A0A0B2W255_TOXCA|nr:hypothetical protein Tcan_08029 [Toxocara canis]